MTTPFFTSNASPTLRAYRSGIGKSLTILFLLLVFNLICSIQSFGQSIIGLQIASSTVTTTYDYSSQNSVDGTYDAFPLCTADNSYSWSIDNISVGQMTSNPSDATCSIAWTNNTTAAITVNVSLTISVQPDPSQACEVITLKLPVSVEPCSAALSTSSSTATSCTGSVTLIANSNSTVYSYTWIQSINGVTSTIQGITSSSYIPTVSGFYSFTAENSYGCIAQSGATQVTVYSIPSVPVITASATSFCAGNSVTLSTPQVTGLTYTWYTSSGTSVGTGVSLNVTTGGTYYVVANNGHCSSPASLNTITITENAVPSATITPATGQSTTFCTGGSVTLNANAGNGLSYLWNVPAGATTGVTTPNYTASIAGNYSVTVSSTASPSCGAVVTSAFMPVTINAIPTASFTTANNATAFCSANGIQLQGNTMLNTGGTGLTYQWSNNNSVLNTTPSTSSTYTATAGGSYTVKIIESYPNSFTCSSTSPAIALTENTSPSAALATITPATSTTFCAGKNVALNTNPGTSTALNYVWNVPAGAATGASANYIASIAGNYSVTVGSSAGCGPSVTSSVAIPVTVNASPAATITPSGPTTFCLGGSVTLNANTGTGLTYLWSNGSTASSATTSTTGSYTVTVTNSNNCSATATTTVNVDVPIPPTVTIVPASSTTICSNASVALNANTGTGSTTGLTYIWNGPGITNVSGSSSYAASAAGSYTVTVGSTAGCGGSATSAPVTVTVIPAPTVAVSVAAPAVLANNEVTICSGNTGAIVFNATGTGIGTGAGLSYQWYFSGSGVFNYGWETLSSGGEIEGYPWNVPSPNFINVAYFPGYKYKVIATDVNNCTASSSPITVTQSSAQAPSVSVTPSGTITTCANKPVTLTASSNGTGLTYQWYDINTGNAVAGATGVTYTPTAYGDYIVIASNSYCSGNSTSSNATVVIYGTASATITASGPTTFCGTSVVLSAPAGLNYQWNTYNGGISTAITGATGQTYTAGSGSYTVTVQNPTGCTTTVTSAVTVVNAIPTPSTSVTVSGPTTFCQGGNITLSVPSVAGLTYQWSNNNTAITNATNYSYTTAVSGSYTVTVTNSSGCSAPSSATTVTVNPLPTAPIISPGGIVTICTGGSTTLSSTTAAGQTYQWYNNGLAVSGATNASLTTNVAGTYNITTKNSSGCSATSSINEQTLLAANNIPTVSIVPMGLPAICESQAEVLQAYATGQNITYQWYYNGALENGFTRSDNEVTAPGLYQIAVSNGCQTVTASITANAINPSEIYTSCGTSYSAGQSVTVSYYLCGITMAADNIYTAQLSDASGSFTNPVAIGTLSSTATYGTINATIPIGTLPGANYRIRVIPSDPSLPNLSDNGANITITNSAGALLFSTGDMVVVPNNKAYNFSTDFTIEAWVKLPATENYISPGIVSNRVYTTAWNGFLFSFTSFEGTTGTNDLDQLFLQINGVNYVSKLFNINNINDNNCHHVAVTRSSGTITFYLDGVAYGVMNELTNTSPISSTAPLYIGYDVPNTSASSYLGTIDDVRIWNMAQPAATIAANRFLVVPGNSAGLVGYWDFNETSGQVVYDQSVIANNGSLGTNPTAIDAADPARVEGVKCFTPALESGLTFNGASPYQRTTIPANADYNFGTGDFAIEGWVNLTGQSSVAAAPALASNRISPSSGVYNGFLFTPFSGTQLLLQVAGINYLSPAGSITTSIYNGACHHIAVARLSGKLQFYVDGLPVGGTVNCAGSINSGSTLFMGYDPIDNVSITGNINELRIWNANRTAAQIAANISTVFSPSTANLIGYWKLDESGDEIIYDQSATANNGYLGTNQFEFDVQNPTRNSNACFSGDRLSAIPSVVSSMDSSSYRATIGNTIMIYPNPTSGSVTIDFNYSQSQPVQVQVFNLLGKEIYSENLGTIKVGQTVANFSSQPSGIYIVQVTSGSTITTQKLVLER